MNKASSPKKGGAHGTTLSSSTGNKKKRCRLKEKERESSLLWLRVSAGHLSHRRCVSSFFPYIFRIFSNFFICSHLHLFTPRLHYSLCLHRFPLFPPAQFESGGFNSFCRPPSLLTACLSPLCVVLCGEIHGSCVFRPSQSRD